MEIDSLQKGQFIVLYGPNNIGKTTQAKLLAERLECYYPQIPGVVRIKYPIYNLEPTGPMINAVFRKGLQMSDWDLQRLTVQNRFDYEPILVDTLNRGFWIVAEDYIKTGVAWGVVKGISLETAEEWNSGLYPEDLPIMMDGDRFTSGIEREHRYEAGDSWPLAREIHLQLARRYNIEVVNANHLKEKVAEDIWNIVAAKYNF